jgi:site-specific DNA-cytosine methylase
MAKPPRQNLDGGRKDTNQQPLARVAFRLGTDCSGMEVLAAACAEVLSNSTATFEHSWAFEIDKFARATILANAPPLYLGTDFTQRDPAAARRIDLYVVGLPCQPFSNAGLRLGFADERGQLFEDVERLLDEQQPSAFLIEHVPHCLPSNFVRVVDSIASGCWFSLQCFVERC